MALCGLHTSALLWIAGPGSLKALCTGVDALTSYVFVDHTRTVTVPVPPTDGLFVNACSTTP